MLICHYGATIAIMAAIPSCHFPANSLFRKIEHSGLLEAGIKRPGICFEEPS
jgi:hypothetical protein